MADLNRAVADLIRDVGLALTTFSEAIRPDGAVADAATPDLVALGLGKRQQEIAELPGLNTDAGMRASEVASEIGYDQANTHTALKTLKDRGVVEELRADSSAPRWRLAGHLRGVSDPYLRMAAFIREGEWSTYGDVSVAVRGDMSAARAVGRLAATVPNFPRPHRVLYSGGVVPPTWRSNPDAPPDPDECVRRLKSEGVTFDEKGRASRANYVSWDVLVERSEREG
jgi:alkylated DNA nucleotide flippase Atl1